MRNLIFFLLFLSASVFGQKPRAIFQADSVMIGNPIKLSMSYLHESKSDIVFPDSSFDFSPFKYISTEYFRTQTREGKSLDSVVYTLVTYNLSPILSLRPYVKNLNSKDRIYADSAHVVLKKLVKAENLRTISVEETTDFFQVKTELNLPKLVYYLFAIFIVCFLVISLFGDWLYRRYHLWKFDNQHKRFMNEFKKKALNPKNLKNIQASLSEWKAYIEILEMKPVSAMSTSEIIQLYENDRLESALKMFDTAIFGGFVSDQIAFAYHILNDFVVKKYKQERKRRDTDKSTKK